MGGKTYKLAVAFGVFDRLHAGHLAFLAQARAKADEVAVIVARDSSVKSLKNKIPRDPEKKRVTAVRSTGLAHKVFLGDDKEGRYGALRRLRPDLIVLGYDQTALSKDLRQRMKSGELPVIHIWKAKPYLPEQYHTRFLAK